MSHEVGRLTTSLSLNADDFELKMSRANEQADKLDGKEVRVKVSADVAKALAEMDAVDAKAAEMQAKADEAQAARLFPSAVASKYLPQESASAPDLSTRTVDSAVTEKAIQDAQRLADAENKLQLAYRDLDNAERAGLNSKSQLATLTDRLLQADKEYTRQAGATASAENDVTHAFDRAGSSVNTLKAAEAARIGILGEVAAAEKSTADATGKSADTANKAADSVSKLSEAQKKSSEAAKASASALKVSFTGIDALLAAIPLLIPLVDGLGSALFATGTSFMTMAAAGALAFAGIREEIANGTQVGQQFSVGMGVLKDDMDQLARTAAIAMLDSFQRTVSELDSTMPTFTSLVSEMSTALGTMGAELVQSVVVGLTQMEPLLNAGATEFGKFTTFLMSWSQGNGFQQFMSDAITTLPQVTTFLEGLITLVEHVFQAFSSIGPLIFGVLNGLVGILNSLPLPVLAGLVTLLLELKPAISLAGLAWNGFAAATNTAATSMKLFGISASLAVPGIGLILAGISALVIMFASVAMSQQKATASATDYAQALQQDNNAIGDNTNKLLAQKLANDGIIDSANHLGIASQDLIGYMDGNTEAIAHVNSAMSDAKAKINDLSQGYYDANSGVWVMSDGQRALQGDLQKTQQWLDANKTALNQESTALHQADQANQDGAAAAAKQAATIAQLGTQYGLTANEITTAVTAHKDYANTVGLQTAAIQALADKYNTSEGAVERDIQSQMQATGTFSQTTLQMQIQNDAAGLLKAAFDNLNNSVLSVDQAQNAAQQAIQAATAAMQQNGADVTTTDKATGLYTSGVLANRQAIDQAAAAAQAHAEAVSKSTGSVQAGQSTMAQDRASMLASMKQQGLLTGSVQDYINKVFQIPPTADTQVRVDAQQALATIANVGIALNSINGRVAVATITTINDTITKNQSVSTQGTNVSNSGAPQAFAWGGRVARLAAGGQNPFAYGTDDQPAMLTAGEEVIPRGSADSMRRDYPGTLEYIRSHGALPQQGGSGPVYLTAYFVNPFTGQQVQAMVRAVATDTLTQAVNGAAAMRPGG